MAGSTQPPSGTDQQGTEHSLLHFLSLMVARSSLQLKQVPRVWTLVGDVTLLTLESEQSPSGKTSLENDITPRTPPTLPCPWEEAPLQEGGRKHSVWTALCPKESSHGDSGTSQGQIYHKSRQAFKNYLLGYIYVYNGASHQSQDREPVPASGPLTSIHVVVYGYMY